MIIVLKDQIEKINDQIKIFNIKGLKIIILIHEIFQRQRIIFLILIFLHCMLIKLVFVCYFSIYLKL